MKKEMTFVIGFVFILVILMSFVSAGFFSNFWGKITGKTIVTEATIGVDGWTNWLNRDNPDGSGDYETKSGFTGLCDTPVAVECRVINTKVPYNATGQVVTATPSAGCYCLNSNNPEGCLDYEVRFKCPVESNCFDSDGGINVGVLGEINGFYDTCYNNTTLIELSCENPLQVRPDRMLNAAQISLRGVDAYQANISCAPGQVCQNGVCINITSSPTCVDSDGGVNYYEKGEENYTGQKTDLNPTGITYSNEGCAYIGNDSYVYGTNLCYGKYPDCFLIENSCNSFVDASNVVSTFDYSGGNLYGAYINCPNGCKDGACINTEEGNLKVSLKVNGEEVPTQVPYKSILNVSWESQGPITNCNTFGSWVPTIDGQNVLGKLGGRLNPSGTLKLMAAFASGGNLSNIGYMPNLTIGIQCWDNSKNSFVTDVVYVPVYKENCIINNGVGACEYKGVTYNITKQGCGSSSSPVNLTISYKNLNNENVVENFYPFVELITVTLKNGVSINNKGSPCSKDIINLGFLGGEQNTNSEENKKPTRVNTSTECTTGCYLDGTCYNVGYRKGLNYCNKDKVFVQQKAGSSTCEDNSECLSNACMQGNCVREGVWKKFMLWLNRFFKGNAKPSVTQKPAIGKNLHAQE